MAWGGTPKCLSKASTPSLQANDLPQLLLGRSKGKNICATGKPWHLLSRAGSPREPPTPQGVVASAYGRLQGRALMTWGEKQPCSDILVEPSAQRPPLPQSQDGEGSSGFQSQSP